MRTALSLVSRRAIKLTLETEGINLVGANASVSALLAPYLKTLQFLF